MAYLLALDQGTSSSRSIVFDAQGGIVAMAQTALATRTPQPGWVEQDAMEIWRSQLTTAREALARAGLRAQDIAALGITNQRETTVLWDRASGEPLAPAIVWQDRRTAAACAALRERGLGPRVGQTTGLLIDPYFSATKIAWLLDHLPGARARAERGELAFGTVDSWLLWQLTGGASGGRHATDVSNASRTLLLDLNTGHWSAAMLGELGVPAALLPEVLPSVADFGSTAAELFGAPIAIRGVAGDQQAALFGQAGFAAGVAKNTYGTGCFMLLHTGARWQVSGHGLIATAAAQPGLERAYALEGSVFTGGAVVQWLRDGLGIIETSADVQALAASVPDSGGVVFVPGFTGLGAPHWRADATASIVGLTRGSTAAHVARAALESIAFQSADLLDALQLDAAAAGAARVDELRVDGGASANDLLMQCQADVLGLPVLRPKVIETTALGAAGLAGLGCGLFVSQEEVGVLVQIERRFEPRMHGDQVSEGRARWARALRQTLAV